MSAGSLRPPDLADFITPWEEKHLTNFARYITSVPTIQGHNRIFQQKVHTFYKMFTIFADFRADRLREKRQKIITFRKKRKTVRSSVFYTVYFTQSSPFSTSTVSFSPAAGSFFKIYLAISVSTFDWIYLLSGRAP